MQSVKKAANFIRDADSLLIAAGAGMGVDSGLPDFRGFGGLWTKSLSNNNKRSFIQYANPQFFYQNPHQFWGFYGWRLKQYRQIKPHQGYQLLTQFCEQKRDHFIITSNVDGSFQQHFANKKIYEVHGSIHFLQCGTCNQIVQNTFQPQLQQGKMISLNLPKCKTCSEILRPNILLFNDWQWNTEISDFKEREYNKFCQENLQKNITIIQLGCGSVVPTIRNMAERMYYANKKYKLVRINPDSDNSHKWLSEDRYVHVQLGALQALKKIKQLYSINLI